MDEPRVAGRRLGRYALYDEIASGGMASVHFGRALGPVGFARTVAIKRLHPHLARDPEFVTMFLDEARLAARIHHPNVVATLDMVARDGELFLVMDYVHGESLSQLLRAGREHGRKPPIEVVAAILCGALQGLHAAHEATSEQGEPLDLVHRDISPQNILVGIDGVARVIDFGVAKAAMRAQSTKDGQVKGKLAYMAPEQLDAKKVDRRTDVYAASVVLWEALAGRRLFSGDDAGSIVTSILQSKFPRLGEIAPDVPDALCEVAHRGLSREPVERFATALEMAVAIERAAPAASQHVVGAWVRSSVDERMEARSRRLARIEATPADGELDAAEAAPPRAVAARAQVKQLSEAETARVPPATSGSSSEPSSGAPAAKGEVTEASLATDAPRRTRRRGSGAIVAVVAAVLGTAVVGIALRSMSRAHSRAGEAADTVQSPSAPAEASATGSAPSPAQPDVASSAGAPQTSSSAPSAAPKSTATATTQTPKGKPAPRATSAPKRADCDPQYTIDQDGVKRFKPWCF